MIERIIKATDTMRELIVLYVSAIIVAALVFSFAEGKSLVDSIWWAMVTAMTVGYGDFYPVTIAGRLAGAVLFHLVPLFIIPLVVVRMCSKMIRDENQFTHTEQEQIKSDLSAIKKALNA